MTLARSFSLAAFAAFTLASASLAVAQQDLRATLFVEADKALAEAKAANAEQLAPTTNSVARKSCCATASDALASVTAATAASESDRANVIACPSKKSRTLYNRARKNMSRAQQRRGFQGVF